MTDIRKEFLNQLVGQLQVYENLHVHGIDPHGNPVPEHHRAFSADYKAGFLAGQNGAVNNFLSLTDSREANGENWRLTTKEGEVVTFYPKDNPVGLPIKDELGNLVFSKGLIAEYYNMVST